MPTTNPTSTTIFKALLCLKTRNSLVLCPHPRARKSTIAAAKIVADAAVAAGAPEGIVQWIENPSMAMSQALMRVRTASSSFPMRLHFLSGVFLSTLPCFWLPAAMHFVHHAVLDAF